MKTRHIKLLAVVGVSSTIAFFLYKAVKTVKEVKQELAFQEAMNADLPIVETPLEVEESEVSELKLAPKFEVFEEMEDETEIIEEEHEFHIDPEDIIIEEGSPLRHPINSKEALEQYKSMRLAGLEPMTYSRIKLLFDYAFYRVRKGDEKVWDRLVEEREHFFTDQSIHLRNITMAELVLYYAEDLDYNLGSGSSYWANKILDNLGVHLVTEHLTVEAIIENVVNHAFMGTDGYGLFGLSDVSYKKMLSNPQFEQVDFDMECNAYIEEKLEDRGWYE